MDRAERLRLPPLGAVLTRWPRMRKLPSGPRIEPRIGSSRRISLTLLLWPHPVPPKTWPVLWPRPRLREGAGLKRPMIGPPRRQTRRGRLPFRRRRKRPIRFPNRLGGLPLSRARHPAIRPRRRGHRPVLVLASGRYPLLPPPPRVRVGMAPRPRLPGPKRHLHQASGHHPRNRPWNLLKTLECPQRKMPRVRRTPIREGLGRKRTPPARRMLHRRRERLSPRRSGVPPPRRMRPYPLLLSPSRATEAPPPLLARGRRNRP